MKPITEWTQADLQALIDGDVQESLTLDYKRSDALGKTEGKRNEMAKDVSAFANSAGGMIVYGIEEDGHHPVRIDGGSDPAQIAREWLEQVNNSRIQPRVHGIRYKAISLDSGGTAFVLDIPTSKNAPHQAPDHKYYRRFEFQSVPMHDYEVRDVMRRHTSPELTLDWRVVSSEVNDADGHSDVVVSIDCRNHSPEPAMYTLCSLIVDKDLESSSIPEFSCNLRTIEAKNAGSHLSKVYIRHFAVPAHAPLFKEAPIAVARVTIQMKPDTQYLVGWQLATPGYAKHMLGFASLRPNEQPVFHFRDVEDEDS